MQIKLTTGRVGTGFSQGPGEIVDVPEDEGRRMVAAGIAEAVDGGRMAEPQESEAIGGGEQQATEAPRENAARRSPRTNR